ncbi:hypothetical protein ACIQO5_10250, partial [Micrococcus luteus]|uniref:hypothetical protein n=1 Tax=Micrococcus luteus TaxID=1270 RepID=UPI00380A70E2
GKPAGHQWAVLMATSGKKHWPPMGRTQWPLTAERRCALTHELVHLEHGHRGCQPPAVEHAVRAAAARQLITLEQLADALPWSMSLDELADELWVTPLVLTDRLAGLTRTEREHLAALATEHSA